MAELIILGNGKQDLKFHSLVENFKKVVKFNYKKNFFKLYVDKNDSIYNITKSEVASWKEDKHGKKIPDTFEEIRDLYFFNKLKGNPLETALSKIKAEIDMEELTY